jgi:hypothetical protein
MSTPLIKYRGAFYRYSSLTGLVAKAAKWVMDKLWGWIVKFGWSKEEVTDWIKKTFSLDETTASRRVEAKLPNLKPDEEKQLVDLAAKLLAKAGVPSGDFARELLKLLDDPPSGYRWERDTWGMQRLKSVRSEIGEHGIVRGKGFADKVLISLWWTTNAFKKSPHRTLLSFIRENDGNVFLSWDIPEDEIGGRSGFREYGAFVIVSKDMAKDMARAIVPRIEQAAKKGEGEFHLGAVKLNRLAAGNRVETRDQVKLPGANSIKFNWDYTLPDLLNGRVTEYKNEKEYLQLVEMLREARDAGKKRG